MYTNYAGYSWMLFIILQTHVLDEGAKHHRDSWWWVKADGCDLISGLAESTRGIWSGDVDVNDGALDKTISGVQQQASYYQGSQVI